MGYDGPASCAAGAEEWAKRGFTGVKAKIGYDTVAQDLEVIRRMRKACGNAMAVMVDYNQSLTPADAIERLRAVDGEALTWIEEPTLAHDYEGHAWIAREIRTPIQCGENWWGALDMRHAIEARASDHMMPDVMKIGGVTGWLRAASLGEAQGIRLSNHLWPEISAQLLSVTPTAHWLGTPIGGTPSSPSPCGWKWRGALRGVVAAAWSGTKAPWKVSLLVRPADCRQHRHLPRRVRRVVTEVVPRPRSRCALPARRTGESEGDRHDIVRIPVDQNPRRFRRARGIRFGVALAPPLATRQELRDGAIAEPFSVNASGRFATAPSPIARVRPAISAATHSARWPPAECPSTVVRAASPNSRGTIARERDARLHVLQRARPSAARLSHAPVFEVRHREPCRRQRRAERRGVIQKP